MYDLFYGLLVRTDPIVAALRKPPSPKGVLHANVVPLLVGPNENGSFAQAVVEVLEPESEESDVDDL